MFTKCLFIYFVIWTVESVAVNKLFGRFGSVRIDFIGATKKWSGDWPEGIRLVNNYDSRQAGFPSAVSYQNCTDYPYVQKESNKVAKKSLAPDRVFTWTASDELLISLNMSLASHASSPYLSPPISWLSESCNSVKIKINSAEISESTRMVEVAVRKELVEDSLASLRNYGFTRKNIFKMLDKGPWVLGFNIPRSLPRLTSDLEAALDLSKEEVIHILSMCPYLLVQYSHFKGRDVLSTVNALYDVGFTPDSLKEAVLQYPATLSASSERIKGWKTLLNLYNIATEHIPKFLKKASFMYYCDPPNVFDREEAVSVSPSSSTASKPSQVSTRPLVIADAVKVLNVLHDWKLNDLDKVIRSQPKLLLESEENVLNRLNFLTNLLSEYEKISRRRSEEANSMSTPLSDELSSRQLRLSRTAQLEKEYSRKMRQSKESSNSFDQLQPQPPNNMEIFGGDVLYSSTATSSDGNLDQNQKVHSLLQAMLTSFPNVLSVDVSKMKSAINALLELGFTHSDVICLVRIQPCVLMTTPNGLKGSIYFLREHCGLSKSEVLPFLHLYPGVIGKDLGELQVKVDYLYRSMGGSKKLLCAHPYYLSYDLVTHIMPRCELLKAIKIDPLWSGLKFFLRSSDEKFTYAAGIDQTLYHKFKTKFEFKWRSNQIDLPQFGNGNMRSTSMNSKQSRKQQR